jgi:endogenous inhibitor of DNA gyrase (YacG/DUF329 family)
MKKIKKLYCVNCKKEITEDDLDDCRIASDGVFCSTECISNWASDEYSIGDSYEELLKEFGEYEK